MRLIFRPLVAYATHLRKQCWNLASSIAKGGVTRRVLDGFLVQATVRKGTAIVDVLDLDAVLLAPTDDYGPNFPGWTVGRSLRAEGNPTLMFTSQDDPIFTEPLARSDILPSRYVGPYTWPGYQNGSIAAHSLTGSFVTSATVMYPLSSTTPRSVVIQRTNVAARKEAGAAVFLTSPLPTDDEVTVAAGARLVEIPIEQFEPRAGATVVAAFATATGDRGFVGLIDAITDDGHETNELIIARYVVTVDESGATAAAEVVYRFGEATVPDEHQSETIHAVDVYAELPSIPGASWTFNSVTGANPDIDLQYNPLVYTRAAYQGSWWLRPVVAVDADGLDTVPAVTAVATDTGINVLVTCRTERDTAAMPGTMRTIGPGSVTAPVTFGDRPAHHEATFLLQLVVDEDTDDTAVTLLPVFDTTVAVNDPRWRDNKFVQAYPIAPCLTDDGTALVCHRIQLRSETLIRDGAGIYACPGYRARVDDSDLITILPDASIVPVSTPGLYPVRYNTIDARTAGKFDFYDDGDDVSRYNYGRLLPNNIALGGEVECSRAYSACHYAQGIAVAVVAPVGGYMDDSQTARLVAFDVASGAVVAEGADNMGFTVQNLLRGGQVTRWHVTCVEAGAVDDSGVLTKHAALLLTLSTRSGSSSLYLMKTLGELQQIGTYPAPLYGGPTYYMGTPLCPAKVGFSTGRSFISGDPVAP
jgi:hypothetical protein